MTLPCRTLIVICALALFAPPRSQAQTETVLYDFTGGKDGGVPYSPLIRDGAGNLYGTTAYGGTHHSGTVFELSPLSDGGWRETVLYSFCSKGGMSCTDGGHPNLASLMFDRKGSLYGTTPFGGAFGYGTVFKLASEGEGKSWKQSVLFSFCGGNDGANPISGLVMDAMGNVYGVTQWGGEQNTGTVFELSPTGVEQVIASINSWGAGLTMDTAGNIFGAEISAVFELSPNGEGGWNSKVIHTFSGFQGEDVYISGTLALDNDGNLYGTTNNGGRHNGGTVYKLSAGENGRWTYTLLHSFDALKNGIGPVGGVVLDSARNIYGTTIDGTGWAGTVYELVAPAQNNGYRHRLLWTFNTFDGSQPYDTLCLDNAGKLYGTTEYGGTGAGVVFEVTP
ncbi:MAG: choice-of-anchor tandem repeat GloVer-containing protein [Terriglobales bacterium]